MATGCFLMPLAAAAEVRRSDGKIVMEEADYRFFITRIGELQAEADALRRVLEQERASFDVYVSGVQAERAAREALDRMNAGEVARLRKELGRMERRRWWPGLIVGGGYGTDGDGVQGVVGLGWKVGP